jgi:hypothetical protein
MPTATIQPPQGPQSTAQLQDWIIKLVRDLNYYMNNLDTLNINRLDAKVIIADTITANKLNVSQLSAISADLGTITAGIIYGAYIATANGTYPRTEFSTTGNLLGVYATALHNILIKAYNSGSLPVMEFNDGSDQATIDLTASILQILGVNNVQVSIIASSLNLQSNNNDISIYPAYGTGKQIRIPYFRSIKADLDGETLQDALDAKQNTISGYTGSFVSGTKTVTVNNGIITSVV